MTGPSPASPPPPASDDPRPLTVEELRRWTDFGATWRPVEIAFDSAVVDLCQCTGELVERRQTRDPAVIDYVRQESVRPPSSRESGARDR